MEGMNTAGAEGGATESAVVDTAQDSGSHEGGNRRSDPVVGSRDAGGRFTKGPADGKQAPAAVTAPATEEELEEIALGNVRGKVPKHIAARIKDLERGFHSQSQRNADLSKKLDQYDKGDIKAIMKMKGVDPDEFAEMTLTEKVKLLEMTPEQKRIMELESERADRLKSDKEIEDQKKADQDAKDQQELEKNLDTDITAAWKDSGLPKDLFFVKQISAVMRDSRAAYRAGKYPEPLTAQKAASIVKGRFEQSVTRIIGQLPPEALFKLLGEKSFNQLREWDLKRVTQSRTSETLNQKRPGTQTPVSHGKKAVGDVEYRDYWNSIGK